MQDAHVLLPNQKPNTDRSWTQPLAALLALVCLSNCGGPRAFTKGEYDDPTRVELLDDKFNESDMQQMADTVIRDMASCQSVANAKMPPTVIVERVSNRTQEHIDTVSLTDKVRVALLKSGKLQFVNKEERDTISEEVDYQGGANVSAPTAKKRGGQIGADYILTGKISTNVQELGKFKLVYYKLTVDLTSIERGTIACSAEREIRKKFSKQAYAL